MNMSEHLDQIIIILQLILLWLMVKNIKDNRGRIDELEKRISELEKRG